ncbi:alpha-hydroxy acid oxidase [Corallococcus caeni]|uniref:alpha-hydroxy acid oxidase n=1 Tax=Corallococcus caeni TaxID=3082388 RepID=UPI0029578566|nr:alpha-hydroxy acid oxidase [Corallococcus sp. KH5-1]
MSQKPSGPVVKLVALEDYRALARLSMSPAVFDYIDGAACDELTTRANRRDLDRVALLPLCMRDVSALELAMAVLGHTFRFPVGFSPTAFHRLVHRDGEVATARAARALDIPMIVSSMSSISLEVIARESGNDNLWLQAYLFKDRELTTDLIRRAECAGFKAIVVTLGCPVPGKRDRNLRNGFRLPDGISAANFARRDLANSNNPISSVAVDIDPSVTWRDLAWLCETTRLPVIAKGVINPLDVAPALELKLSGIMVSNHGGRQLDTTVSTISVLPEIVRAVAGRVPVFVDSGFRRGTDVFKALAAGADGVFVGRPVMWALAVGGEAGVVGAMNLLVEELRVAMLLAGCASAADARREAAHLLRWR